MAVTVLPGGAGGTVDNDSDCWQVGQLIMTATVLAGGTADHDSDCIDKQDSWLLIVLTGVIADHDSDLSGGTAVYVCG